MKDLIIEDILNKLRAKLLNDGWDGSDSRALEIIEGTVAPDLLKLVYFEYRNEFKQEIGEV